MKIVVYRDGIVPTRAYPTDAGLDLYTPIDVYLPAHEEIIIDTLVAMEIPEGYFGAIFARSGLAAKQGLRPANCVGVIDSDYRGPVKVALHNDTQEHQIVHQGDRIAQLLIQPVCRMKAIEVDDLNETRRGRGGFGSTGI